MSGDWLFGLAAGQLLAQSRPTVNTATTLFTAKLRTEITVIRVCNVDSSARTFRIFHDDSGTSVPSYTAPTALYWDYTVPVGSTVELKATSPYTGITLRKNGALGVRTDTASALTFSAYGVVQSAV